MYAVIALVIIAALVLLAFMGFAFLGLSSTPMLIAAALLFLAGAGFAVYGLAVFIRNRLAAMRGESGHPDNGLHGPEDEDGGLHETAAPAHAAPHAAGPAPYEAEPEAAQPAAAASASSPAGPGVTAPLPRRFTQRFSAKPGVKREPVMDKLFIRCLIVAAITLGLLIPLAFVGEIVDERSDMRRRAVHDIAGLWGSTQTVNGPVLVIPFLREYTYTENVKNSEGKEVTVSKKGLTRDLRVVLPAAVDFEASLHPQIRRRGIYEYVVYTSPIAVKGVFRLPRSTAFGDNLHKVEWEKAWFAIGITDLKAITGVEPLRWAGRECPPYSPGTNLKSLLGPGFQAEVGLSPEAEGAEQEFSLKLNINGSGGLYFTPVGETTRIAVSGDWPHPSFSGNILPTSRTITDTDFKAEWIIPHLSRTYPQIGTLGKDDFSGGAITDFTAGLNLFETVSLYSQVDRAVKYGILFIGLTFVALLSFELVTRARLHMMQYGLVGIAMTLFYLVLLSLAEHTLFYLAFAAAAAVSVLMNSLYIAAAMRSGTKGLIIAGLLTALYLLLYTLLQMEEYALLIGTGLVLLVVGVLMFLTRHLPGHSEAKTGLDKIG